MNESVQLDYLSLLGLESHSPVVNELLINLKTRIRPGIDADEEGHNFYSWVLVRRQGIEFGFQDRAYLYAEDPSLRTCETLILSDIIFYNWPVSDLAHFAGTLPLGLKFSDSRAEVKQKLADPTLVVRSYKRDTFDFRDFQLIVSYMEADSAISDIVLRLRLNPWPEAKYQPRDIPELGEIQKLFGASPRSPEFLELFHAFEPESQLSTLPRERSIDCIREAGFELFFQKPTHLKITAHEDGLVLAALKLYRQREKDARQWPGQLPFGLSFDDSPSALFLKIEDKPEKIDEDDIQGYALWRFQYFDVLVLYSVYENLISHVQIMAKGYYDSLFGKS